MTSATLSRLALICFSSIWLLACSKQMSLESYNKLQLGQTVDEVNTLVGPPARCDEVLGVRSCVWGDEQHGINVSFVAGKVILMSAKGLK